MFLLEFCCTLLEIDLAHMGQYYIADIEAIVLAVVKTPRRTWINSQDKSKYSRNPL